MKQNSIETGIVNAGAAQWIPPTTTFASPPQSPVTGTLYLFTDASSSGANTGGGSALSQCRWSGQGWVATSGAGGAGGQTPWTSNIDGAGFKLNNAGGIGVGVVADASRALTVQSSAAASFDISTVNTNALATAGMVLQNDQGDMVQFGLGGSNVGSASLRRLTFLLSTRDLMLGTGSSFTERVRISATTGNVGIAQNNPAYKLDVTGDINTTGVFRVNGVPLAVGVSSVFTRTGAVTAQTGDYTAAQVTNAVDQTAAYANPSWITSIAWSKITGAPSVSSYQTPWLSDINAASFKLNSVSAVGIGMAAPALPSKFGLRAATDGVLLIGTGANKVEMLVLDDALSASATLGIQAATTTFKLSGGAIRMVLDTTGVAISKTSAAYPLDVAGDCNITGVYRVNGVPIVTSSQTPWTSNIDAAGFQLNNAGAIGIGGPSTAYPLDVRGVDAPLHITATGGGGRAGAFLENDSGDWVTSYLYGSTASTPRIFAILSTRDIVFGTTTERMRITTAGNVGIGNTGVPPVTAPGYSFLTLGPTTPVAPCGIFVACSNGTANGQAMGSYAFANYNLAAADKRIASITGVLDGTPDSIALEFSTANAGVSGLRMRITAAGNVGIGTNNPGTILSTSQSLAPIKIAVFDQGPGTPNCYGIGVQTNMLTFGANINAASGTPQMILNNSGQVGIGTNTPSCPLEVRSSVGNGRMNVTFLNAGGSGIGNRMRVRLGTHNGFDQTDLYPYIEAYNASSDGSQVGLAFGVYQGTVVEVMRLGTFGVIALPTLPSANPGAGTKQLWYDPADGNRVKFAA